MIKSTFLLGADHYEVIVNGNEVMFCEVSSGTVTTISGLQLSRQGVIKEFPELENDKNWREKAIFKFQEHIKKLPSEKARTDYIYNELKKYGYEPLYWQRAGHRPQKFKDGI